MQGRLAPSSTISRIGASRSASPHGADFSARPKVSQSARSSTSCWRGSHEGNGRARPEATGGSARLNTDTLLLSRGEALASIAAASGGSRAGSGDGQPRRTRPTPAWVWREFWQFRQYVSATRRSGSIGGSRRNRTAYSARTEGEAAQSVWLWRDGSPSMRWSSLEKPSNETRPRRRSDGCTGLTTGSWR